MISGLPRRWDSLKETFDMKDNYKLDFRKVYNAMKRAFVQNEKSLIFISQVVRYGSGPSLKYTYKKMLESSSGGEMAYKSEEISDYISSLEGRPLDSVGRECYAVFKENQIKVVKVSRRKSNDEWIEAKHPYSWMARRYRDTHDIWHILTDYPTTVNGEMCLTMFSFAQTRSLGWLTISLSILFAHKLDLRKFKMVYEAYKNGKKAKFLLAEDYNKLLSENLQDARKRLNIKQARFFDDISPNLLKL